MFWNWLGVGASPPHAHNRFPARFADEFVVVAHPVDQGAICPLATHTRAHSGFFYARELGDDAIVTVTEPNWRTVPVKDLLDGLGAAFLGALHSRLMNHATNRSAAISISRSITARSPRASRACAARAAGHWLAPAQRGLPGCPGGTRRSGSRGWGRPSAPRPRFDFQGSGQAGRPYNLSLLLKLGYSLDYTEFGRMDQVHQAWDGSRPGVGQVLAKESLAGRLECPVIAKHVLALVLFFGLAVLARDRAF